MSAEICRYEPDVIEATHSGEWSEHLRSHLRGCAECAESVRVAEWLGGVAIQLGRDQPAPDPTYIWLKAEIERRAEDAAPMLQRTLSPLAFLSLAAGLAGAAAALAVWPQVAATVSAARSWLSTAAAETSLVDMTAIGSGWIGLPVLLVVTYLVVFRPSR
jgi:hypothetical protein